MALITIFSSSVSAFALSPEEWEIVDYISNVMHEGYNCSLVYKNTSSPSPDMVNLLGYAGTQKTTFNLMVAMYETVSSQGAHFINNTLMQGVFELYEYGGYYWIKFDPDGSTGNYWVGNKQGKILYCESPDTSDEYTVSMIAGAGGYYLTDRPVGTTDNDYLGDLKLSYDNWSSIMTRLNDLSANTSYYTFLYSVNGEMRYHIASLINGTKYFVCNSSGQIFYYIKEDADSGGNGDGSSFDATEIITAINSVYDAIDVGFWDVCNWLDAIQDNISSFNTDVLIMSQNMTNGFTDLHNVGDRINNTLIGINTGLFSVGDEITYSIDYLRYKFVDYFESLGRSYSRLLTVKLSGEDNSLFWDDSNRVQSVEVSNNGPVDTISFSSVSEHESSLWSVENLSDGYSASISSSGDSAEYTCVAPNGYDTTFYYNWCVNGDFRNPKNSKGQTVYTTLGNTINGWRTTQVASTITVEDGYVNLSVTNSSDRYRYFCYDLGTDYKLGYTYTISLLADVKSVSGDVRFRASDYGTGFTAFSGSSISLTSTDGVTLFTTTFKNTKQTYTDSRVEFYMAAGSTCDIDIYAVKVENHKEQSLAFEGYDGNWHFFTDVYSPPNLQFKIDGQLHQLSTSLFFCKNGHDRIFYDEGIERWYVYRYSSGTSSELPASDQSILNKCFPFSSHYIPSIHVADLSVNNFSALHDGLYSVDVSGEAVVIVNYYHTGSWFEHMYYMMGMLYDRIGEVDSTVVNIENTVVDIVQDNDAFNIFYVEKTDGTTESVGDAAKDAAIFVGDVLSMFYRLVFDDALSNTDILKDFEGVYSNTEVSVW